MTTTATTTRTPFQAPVSVVARAAIGLAVVGFVSVAWLSAGAESQHTVQATAANLSRTYVTLPAVQITAKREGKLAEPAI